jgi:TatA/E family protein of Tat protein translocase
MGIGNPIHLMFLAAVALVVLGPKRLPEFARALGKGMQEFRDSMNAAVNGEDPQPSAPVPGQPQLVAAEPVAQAEAPDQVAPEQSAPQLPS